MPSPPPGPQRQMLFGSVSTVFPLLGARSGLVAKGHLFPVAATIMAGIGLGMSDQFQFVHTFTPELLRRFVHLTTQSHETTLSIQQLQDLSDHLNGALQICWIIGAYVTLMANYFVYMLCGRSNRWWLFAGTFGVMATLILGPLGQVAAFYNEHTLGDPGSASAAWRIIGAFIGPGVGEEIVKALPVFALAALAVCWSNPLSRYLGVAEPLDGILVGVASGAAFALTETVGQYVPVTVLNRLRDSLVNNGPDSGLIIGSLSAKFDAVLNLLMRTLPEIAGHIAYSGIFGYFIGLAVLKRSSAPLILLVGLLSAATLHGSWDALAFSSELLNPQLERVSLLLIAILSYAFLASCILKGRKISPTRAQNFASVVIPNAAVVPPPPLPRAAAVVPKAVPIKASPANVSLVMRIGPNPIKLTSGRLIEPIDLGSAGAGRGKNPIAEIAANPNDGNVLGLRNLSDRTYRVTLTGGKTVDLPKGKAVRLAPGVVVDFGGITGSVEAG
jgi:RsiW-degrading membrane proteinase PrsW (M82 family)